jgi:lipopolysaccharide exporter
MSQSPKNLSRRLRLGFGGDVLRLVTGTAFSQAIGILAAPILTRLFAPEAFGLAAMFTSIVAIFGVFACMSYEQSIVLPEDDRDACNLLAVSLSFSILVSLLSIPVIWIAKPLIMQVTKMPELGAYLWLIPVAILVQGIFISLSYWNTRSRCFTRLSIARVTNQLTATSTTLLAGLAGSATGGTMIVAGVIGPILATTILAGQVVRNNAKLLAQSICWQGMLTGLKSHKKFPIYTTGSALLNVASWQIPVLLFGIYFPPAIVGYYALAFRMVQMPMSLLGSAIGQVFLQRASEENRKGTLAPLVEKLFNRLLILTLFPCAMLTIIGQDIFELIFGENWAVAGTYVQILAPWTCVWFIASPLTSLYYVLGRQREEYKIQLAIFITRLASVGIGIYFNDPIISLILFSITGVITYGYVVKIVFNFVGLNLGSILRKNSKLFMTSFIYLIPMLIAKTLNADAGILLLISSALLAVYFARQRPALLASNKQIGQRIVLPESFL